VGKGTTVERLEITQRRENFRDGNYVSGPEFPPLDKISEGNVRPFEIRLSPLRNVVVQRAVRGPEILVWQNFRGPEIISGPRKFG
jgi:hypothetical protein